MWTEKYVKRHRVDKGHLYSQNDEGFAMGRSGVQEDEREKEKGRDEHRWI